jgi:beta-glucosidase
MAEFSRLTRAAVMAVAVVGIAAPAATGSPRGDQSGRASGDGFTAPGLERTARAAQATPTTWDTDPAVEARANAILAQMTTEEKADLATGELNNFYGFYNNPEERVGIPAQTMADGPVGVRIANPNVDRRSTEMPSGTAMAASFDRDLLRLVGETLGDEAYHTGHNVLLAPSVDIARTPLWGRAFEGFGEDPFLNGTMGTEYIRGVQSNPVMATIKHFAVNDQETNRFTVSSEVDDRTLHEIYTKPYELAVRDAKPGAAMCSFNRINGVYACGNPLMNTLLKGEYGHRGFIMSDYNATPANTEQAANNGLDQEQPGDQGPGSANFGERLVAAVQDGRVPMSRLNDMVRRQLRPMIGLGLFENPVLQDRFDERAHGQVARRVAREGMVLLKNNRSALPLRPGRRLRTLAVIGPDADNASAKGGGSSTISEPTYEVSPLEGIRDRAGDRTSVTYAAGTDGVSEADLLPGPSAVPSTVLRPSGGDPGERGLHVQLWNNTDFAGDPQLDLDTPNANMNLGFYHFAGFNAASPKDALSQAIVGRFDLLASPVSARWTGNMIAPDTADYRLGVTSRGTARLYLDGELLVENTSDTVTSKSVSVNLRAGQPHDVRVEYSGQPLSQYQGGQVRFFWEHDDSVMAPAMRDAVADARAADAAVVVVRDYETEGGSRQADRPDLNLPKEQDQLIRRVSRANPNTVVVITTGGVTKTSNWEEDVPAILQAWYPGQEQGNAIADVVFGDVNPSGKLPATVPNDESQVPPIDLDLEAEHDEGVFVGYRSFQQRGDTPSYPFGYGLSYSRFRYTRLRVDNGPRGEPQGDITVSFRIRNRSNRAGAEVAQVYIGRLPTRSVATPPRQLAGFAKVQLDARQRRAVTVTIPRRSLSYWDTGSQHWVTPAGSLPVYVGSSSEDTALAGTITVRP